MKRSTANSPFGPRALLVEDEPVAARAVGRALEEGGLTVQILDRGADTFATCRRERPDVVLLDISLPDSDGLAICEAIRQSPWGQDLPIAVITASDEVELLNAAYDAGATEFLVKPVPPRQIIHRVRSMLRAHKTLQELRSSQSRLELAQSMARMGDWEWFDASDRLLLSSRLKDLVGAEENTELGDLGDLLVWVHPDDYEMVNDGIERLIASGESLSVDHRLLDSRGEILHVHHEAQAIGPDQGHNRRIIGAVQDITPRKHAEAEIARLAYSDPLTGLPNRSFLLEHLGLVLKRAARAGHQVSLLCLDLDRFKQINDTLGHAHGDELLRQAAERLNACVRESDLLARFTVPGRPRAEDDGSASVARFGGDEFLIVLPEVTDETQPAQLADRVVAMLSKPYAIEGNEVVVSTSVGIAVADGHAGDRELLLRNADAAMYEAKGGGGNRYAFYDASMTERVRRRLSLENDLRRALERDELELYYQPCLHVDTLAVIGVEALARWQHPERGLVMPSDFIEMAEETGLIVPLGDWALNAACAQLQRWGKRGIGVQRVAVNVSARQLREGGFHDLVLAILQQYELDPSQLELELTENMLLDVPPEVFAMFERMRKSGVRIALDDFGTGYSSLSYLREVPVDTVKIDRAFVKDLPDEPGSAAIVSSITGLMRKLGLDVVAEGVETPEQRRFLQQHGCAAAQGRLWADAMPAKEFEAWLKGWNAR